MKITKITKLKKDLEEIKNEFSKNGEYSLDELNKFAVFALSIFEEIGIPEKLKDNFLTIFNIYVLRDHNLSAFTSVLEDKNKFEYDIAMKERLSALWLAIEYSENKLKYLEYEENIVPKWLLDSLSENKKLEHVSSLVVALDEGIKKKSSSDVLTRSVTLLDAILDLEEDFNGKDIGKKVQILSEDKKNTYRYKFGNLSQDFFRGLNNSRIIRNVKVVHPTVKIKYDTSYLITITTAYLIITLLEATLATGELIK